MSRHAFVIFIIVIDSMRHPPPFDSQVYLLLQFGTNTITNLKFWLLAQLSQMGCVANGCGLNADKRPSFCLHQGRVFSPLLGSTRDVYLRK